MLNITVCLVFIFSGCVSTEETGARAKTPLHGIDRIDTLQGGFGQDSAEIFSDVQQKVAPRFNSKEDTLLADVITRSKMSPGSHAEIETAGKLIYTVQIGAYYDASHALLRQKKAKEQFAGQPVFNKYEESTKLYRVSIGMYQEEKDAEALADSLKQKYPDEYKQCWINYIP